MSSDRGPLDEIENWLPTHLRRIVDRDTPIPTIAQLAAERAEKDPGLVRADIGQITGLDPEHEVLYGPPSGLPALRTALAELWMRSFRLDDYGVKLEATNVAITTGAAEGLSLTFGAIAHERTVGVPRAHWENYSNGVDAANGAVVLIDYFDASGRLDPDALSTQITRHGIQVLVANFPANPTGAVLTHEEADAIASVARKHDLFLVCDEVYARLRFDDQPPVSLLSHAPERTICVSSASKEYLLPGARVGYAICTRSDFTNRVMRKLTRAHTASPNVLGQQRLLALVTEDLADLRNGTPPRHFTRVLIAMRKRRDALVAILAKHGLGVIGRPNHLPSGTIFLCAELPSWWTGSDFAFVEKSIDCGAFSAIPGSAFGLDRAIRFSFGGLDDVAMERLDANLATLRERVGST